MNKSLMQRIKEAEGFSGTVYKCTQGFDTIGYGTKLPITKKGAELLIQLRLNEKIDRLHKKLDWLDEQPQTVKEILYDMAYQMGVTKIMAFKKTLAYIKDKDYTNAAKEMLDSGWANQTPKRAKRLSKMMREAK
ncbi:glycoside hydrolase family protein [Sulfurimonas sp.]|uniref:glycoside hydrolase family protein n=1 Tax=Sulfurimonas sp. TaxID=2022749 RepID=UPI0025EF117D|nr:glycoside hydrolase family protein [Sulfurimonas sp.]